MSKCPRNWFEMLALTLINESHALSNVALGINANEIEKFRYGCDENWNLNTTDKIKIIEVQILFMKTTVNKI